MGEVSTGASEEGRVCKWKDGFGAESMARLAVGWLGCSTVWELMGEGVGMNGKRLYGVRGLFMQVGDSVYAWEREKRMWEWMCMQA